MSVIVGYVPTKTGSLALDEAVREARAADSELIVLNVIGEKGHLAPTAADEIELDAVTADLKRDGVAHSIRHVVATTSAADTILELASAENASLIVLGLHRRSRVGKMLLGSTAQSVILAAHCPVLTVPDVDD